MPWETGRMRIWVNTDHLCQRSHQSNFIFPAPVFAWRLQGKPSGHSGGRWATSLAARCATPRWTGITGAGRGSQPLLVCWADRDRGCASVRAEGWVAQGSLSGWRVSLGPAPFLGA